MCTLTFMYLVELTTHVTHLSRQICFYIIVQTSINDMNGKYLKIQILVTNTYYLESDLEGLYNIVKYWLEAYL